LARKSDIRLRRSAVSGSVPGGVDLNLGELALNTADGAIFVKNGAGNIVTVSHDGILHYDEANSRIGVGTTVPDRPLHVNGGTTDYVARFESSDNNTGIELKDSTSTGAIRTQNGHMVYIADTGDGIGSSSHRWNIDHLSTGEKMRLNAAGELGIGTQSPQAKLDIQNATAGTAASVVAAGTSAGIYLEDDQTPTDNYFVSKVHNPGNDTAIGGIKFAVSPDASNYSWAGIKGLTSTSGNAGNLAFYTSAGNSSGDSSTERMRIDVAGNVGIGVTSLVNGDKLTVNGNINLNGKLFNGTSNNSAGLDFASNYVNYHGYAGHRFYAQAAGIGSMAERMRITVDGNVGIGTTAPVKELHVDGTFVTEGGARSNPTGINNAVVIDYQQSAGNTGRLRSRDWAGATWRDFAIEAANINLMASGNVGIGTDTPGYALDLIGATNYRSLLIGQSEATGTKRQAIAARHYTSSEEPHNMIGMFTDSNTNSILAIGGGLGVTGDFNSVTEIQLHTGNGTTTGTTAAMVIDSSGRVGINNTSPSLQYFNNLVVGDNSAGDKGITIRANSANKGVLAFSDTDSADANRYTGYIAYEHTDDSMRFHTNGGGEKMRIRHDGILLVGTTDHTLYNNGAGGNTGFLVEPSGTIQLTKSNNITAYFNRIDSDGEILSFRKNGAGVGGIANDSTSLVVTGSSTGLKFGTAAIWPTTGGGVTNSNGAKDLGASTAKFKDLHLSGKVNAAKAEFTSGSADHIYLNRSGHDSFRIALSHSTGLSFYNQTDSRTDIMVDGSGNIIFGGVSVGAAGAMSVKVDGSYTDLYLYGAGTSQGGRIFFGDSSDRSSIVGTYGTGGGGKLSFKTDTTGGTSQDRLVIDSDGSITFNGAFTFPTTIGAAGQILKVPATGTELIWGADAGGGSATLLTDGDGDTLIQVEKNTDEDIIRFDVAGSEVAQINSTGLTVASNITTTGYLRGPASFVIDPAAHGDDTGTVVIAGNLQIDGTTTTINSTTLDVDDINITVAKGSANAAAANGAGLTVDGASATLTYVSSGDKWEFNKNLNFSGDNKHIYFNSTNTFIGESSNSNKLELRGGGSGTLQTVFINSSGNLGIGVVSPVAKLHVKKASAGTTHFDSYATAVIEDTEARLQIISDDGGNNASSILLSNETKHWAIMHQGPLSNNRFSIGYDLTTATGTDIVNTSSHILNITTDGKVGIGTTSPERALHVVGGIHLPNNNIISWDQADGTLRNAIYVDSGDDMIIGDTNFDDIYFSTGQKTKTVVIKQTTGNVGIGTDSPAEKLEVSGGHIKITNTGNANLYINANNAGSDATIYFEEEDSVKAKIQHDASNDSMLFTDGALADTMTLKGTRVGIGTSSPGYKLEISDDTNSTVNLLRLRNADSTYSQTWDFQLNTSKHLEITGASGSGGIVLNPGSTGTTANNGLYVTGSSTLQTAVAKITRTIAAASNNTYTFEVDSSSHTSNMTAGGAMKVDVNSGRAFTINGFGNVGIGTTSPTYKLHVQSPDANDDVAYIHHDNPAQSSGTLLKVRTDAGDSSGYTLLDVQTNSGSALFVRGDRKVGIGTNNPSQTFTVENNSGIFRINTSTSTYPRIEVGSASGTTAAIISRTTATQNIIFGETSDTGNYIFRGGNVGIGTTPGAKLHVNSSGTIGWANLANAFILAGTTSSGIGIDDNEIVAKGSGNLYFGTADSGDDVVIRAGGSAGAMYISGSNQRVGIAKSIPLARFQVEEYGIDTTTSSTAATTQVAIHTFPIANFRSARFTVQITNSTDSTYHSTEILSIHDGTTANITEFGEVHTGSSVEATFDADVSSGNFRLLATPTSTNSMVFKVVCHSLTV
jgi:hypothetical protein